MKLRSFASTEGNAKIVEMNTTVSGSCPYKRAKSLLLISFKIEAELLDSMPTPCGLMPELNHHKGAQNTQGLNVLKSHGHLEVLLQNIREKNPHLKHRIHTTGCYGMRSEVQWLRAVATAYSKRIYAEAGDPYKRSCSCTPSLKDTDSYNFWVDDESIDPDYDVDPNELPPRETAEILLDCYVSKVHDSFPILSRMVFENQFRRCFTTLHHPKAPRLDPTWQAILNLVFSINASYLQLAKGDYRVCGNVDHVAYFMRARALDWNIFTLTGHSSISQVQGLGLLALLIATY
jgi:hypothetical protein